MARAVVVESLAVERMALVEILRANGYAVEEHSTEDDYALTRARFALRGCGRSDLIVVGCRAECWVALGLLIDMDSRGERAPAIIVSDDPERAARTAPAWVVVLGCDAVRRAPEEVLSVLADGESFGPRAERIRSLTRQLNAMRRTITTTQQHRRHAAR